jgi:hypothetical protein
MWLKRRRVIRRQRGGLHSALSSISGITHGGIRFGHILPSKPFL